jgi:hypothetical protein
MDGLTEKDAAMKKIIAAVAILFLSTSLAWAQVAPVADSLVVNTGHENSLDSWGSWFGTKARSTTGQRSGIGALTINPSSIQYQEVTARSQAGHTYHLNAYVKDSTFFIASNIATGVEAFDLSGNVNNPTTLRSYSTSYQQVSMDFQVPAGVGSVDVFAAKTGSAWVDASDARIAATPTPTPTLAPPTPTPTPSGPSETIGRDWESWNWQQQQAHSPMPYWTYNSTWNENGLVNGRDFTQTITMYPNSFPSGTVIEWSWPNKPALWNVYSFPMLVYGTYAGLAAPITNVTAKQINNITTLTLSHDLSISGDPEQFDVIYDAFLAKVPVPGTEHANSIFEIEVHCHTPSYFSEWLENGHTRYSFTDSQGTHWSIFDNPGVKPHMIVFVRADYGDLLNYTVDMKALLVAARSHGLLTGNEYWTGTGLGVEPQMGSGSLTINSFSVVFR